MKIFVSWSGNLSHEVALLLKDWLKNVIHDLDVWVSSEDIEKGAVWFSDLAETLENGGVGIICLARDNLNSNWIHFEAGALFKGANKSKVCTFLIDLGHAEVGLPLSNFNGTVPSREDMRRLLVTINNTLKDQKLDSPRLEKAFEEWWDSFESSFNEIISKVGKPDCVGYRGNLPRKEYSTKIRREEVRFELLLQAQDRDVVKIYCYTHSVGIEAERRWMEENYPGWEILGTQVLEKKTINDEEIIFDRRFMKSKSGYDKQILFDVSDFFDEIPSSVIDKFKESLGEEEMPPKYKKGAYESQKLEGIYAKREKQDQ